MKRQERNGFTLVEVMVTIAILLILAAFFKPEIDKAKPNLQLRSLAYDVLTTMQRARSLAVQKNTSVRVYFDEDGYGYKLIEDINRDGNFSDGEANPIVDIKFADYGDARRIKSCGGVKATEEVTIIFTSRGTANSNTIYLDNGLTGDENHHCYEIGSLSTGSVKLEKK